MAKITSVETLDQQRYAMLEERQLAASKVRASVRVGMGSCGIAVGAKAVWDTLNDELKVHQLQDVVVSPTGCMGLCSHEPIVEVTLGNLPKVAYGNVNPEKLKRIVREHIIHGSVVEEFVVDTSIVPTL